MPKFEFCLPTTAKIVPGGADWFHEIKYDGYRLRIERGGKAVRGHDWTSRYPWIAEAALRNRSEQFVIDGEAVVLGVDGVSDFNALHSGKSNPEVQLCALRRAGDRRRGRARAATVDAQGQPPSAAARPPRRHLRRPIRNRRDRARAVQGRLHHAMGLEGLVSKPADRPYQSGRCPHWIKVKNRTHHAFDRVAKAHRER
jgi:ATP-dependent DNA ligase